jgi:hypothetical protein
LLYEADKNGFKTRGCLTLRNHKATVCLITAQCRVEE